MEDKEYYIKYGLEWLLSDWKPTIVKHFTNKDK